MAEALSVRAARPTDRGRLQQLWLELVEHHRQLDPGYRTISDLPEILLGEIEEAIRSPRFRVLVAEQEDQLLGFALAEIQHEPPRPAWIHELYVVPRLRRSGVGRRLVAATLEWFGAEASERILVRVESENAEARAFWDAHGFKDRARVLERIL